MPQLLLVDGLAVLFRSHFSVFSRVVIEGRDVSAVNMFFQSLGKVLAMVKPTHLAVTLDAPGAVRCGLPSARADEKLGEKSRKPSSYNAHQMR